jgi:hypothetical protein
LIRYFNSRTTKCGGRFPPSCPLIIPFFEVRITSSKTIVPATPVMRLRPCGLLLAVLLFVQSTLAALAFTNTAFDLEVGQPFTLTWTGASGSVTITLMDATSSTNLVEVQTIVCTYPSPPGRASSTGAETFHRQPAPKAPHSPGRRPRPSHRVPTLSKSRT